MFRLRHILFFTIFAFSAIAETDHFSEIGAAGEARTRDPRVKDPLLFWLSYDGMVRAGGFEPPLLVPKTRALPGYATPQMK